MKHVDSAITTATEDSIASAEMQNGGTCSIETTRTSRKQHFWTIPYTTSLPLLVMLDMLGVSLVVPLLHSQYFKLAGVNTAVQREWLSSIFSASQIVGGLAIGALSDSAVLTRHSILMMSFLGSAFAYFMIQQGGLAAIVVSRVTVGLVKQTMTVTSSIMAHSTEQHERAIHVGRLNASVTVAWIVGPSAGAYLFHNVGTYAPIHASCAMFLLNTLIVLFCLPKEVSDDSHYTKKDAGESKSISKDQKPQSALARVVTNFQACFHSSNACLASVVSALLLFQWVMRTTSYKNIATYYETRYGMEPYQRGYLQSYQAVWRFVVQSLLVRPILSLLGGEVNAICVASLAVALATFAELYVSFPQYLILVCPLMSTALSILGVSLNSTVSKVAPKQSLGSVFATIDVLSNAAQVTVPFYRTMLFSFTQPDDGSSLASSSGGDPDPYQWQMASGVHWLVASAAFAYLLLKGSPCSSAAASNTTEGTTTAKKKKIDDVSSKKVKAA